MTAQLAPSKRHDRRAEPLAHALEQRGLVDPLRHDETILVIDSALAGREAAPAALRRRLVELAAYVGAAFVVAAVVLFVGQEWENLAFGQRLTLLAASVGILLASGLVAAHTGQGRSALRSPALDVRRRLSSALLTGAAATAAVTVGMWVLHELEQAGEEAERGWLVGLGASSALLLLAVFGYLVAPTLLGQLAVAAGAMYFVPFAYSGLGLDDSALYGLTVLGLGLLWLALAEKRLWREQTPARVLGGAMALVGPQTLIGLEMTWQAYLLTLLVAALGFTLYVLRRGWPYLAVGVVGVTVAVPEALLDWTEGSLGTAGVLLVAGVTLIAASLLGMRLREETKG